MKMIDDMNQAADESDALHRAYHETICHQETASVIANLVTRHRKFQFFLDKGNIELITNTVQELHGQILDVKLDYNEIFDTMTVSWTEDQLKEAIWNPVMVLTKYYCVNGFKKIK